MEISQITNAINAIGFNPAGITNIDNEDDIQKFAEENGLNVDEAKVVLHKAEQKAEEISKNNQEQSAMLNELTNSQDEEDSDIIDDADFDNFLKEINVQDNIQNFMNKNSFNDENPFLKK